MKLAAGVCTLLLLLSGCASIAPPLPPALHLAARVTDLSAVQRGSEIYIQFTMPKLTTEAMPIEDPPEVELRIGPSAQKFEMKDWLETAKVLPAPATGTLYRTAAAPYSGKDVVVAVRLKNDRGKDAGWSNFVALSVTAPVPRPENVVAEATREGVRISWTGDAASYRIYRKTAKSEFAPLGEAKQSPYIDTTAEYGQRYTYFVMGFETASESELSAEVSLAPVDVFPPAVPEGLKAIIGTRTIELSWARNTESDLGGYRVYRAEADGAFGLINGNVLSTGYSDRTVKAGVRYRYAVSAFDQTGNESAKTEVVEAMLP